MEEGPFIAWGYCLLNGEKNAPDQRVKRLAKVTKNSVVAKRVEEKLQWCTQPVFKALSKIQFTPMKDLINHLPSSSPELAVDIL